MIIAIDFDGTIVEHAYPEIGNPIPFAIDTLLQLQKDGHQLILWSVRDGALLRDAIDYCAQQGLYFYAENENYRGETKEKESVPRKLKADLFIDDRNLGGLPDWGVIDTAGRAPVTGGTPSPIMAGGSARPEPKKKRRWF